MLFERGLYMKTQLKQIRTNIARKLLEKGIEAELGIAGTADLNAARRFYRRAALLGNRQAQVFLAYYYALYLDFPFARRLALAWFKRAAYSGEELCTLVVSSNEKDPKLLIREFKRLISQ